MKIAPTKLLLANQAPIAPGPPISITHAKREGKLAAGNLVKFDLKVHLDDTDSTLKYTKNITWLSAQSSPKETLATLVVGREVCPWQSAYFYTWQDCHSFAHCAQ